MRNGEVMIKRRLKDFCQLALAVLFRFGQLVGFDILPRHFYSEIPDIRKLRRADHWRKAYSMIGVLGADADEQLEFASQTVSPDLRKRIAKGGIHERACKLNGELGFGGPVEAAFLYAFVATHRPKRIVQVGCGVSTAVCIEAAKAAGFEAQITCIDPYPTQFLNAASAEGRIRLVREPVECLDYSFLAELSAGDLFFVDSTHTLGPAGEASRIVLEMLPRLRKGTLVHFHDIWFPYDYRYKILDREMFFWHESVLLHAFLTHNPRFAILASLSMLSFYRQKELSELLPVYQPPKTEHGLQVCKGHYPTSIYLKVLCS